MATINGTVGNDVIVGTTLDDVITGGEGNDRLNGGAGNDLVFGGPGTDTLTGDAGNDRLYGGDGNDGFFGGGGDDTAYGEAGNDVMYGDGGNDIMYGGDGDDQLDGGTGNDVLYGNDGNDTLAGGTGDDQLYGGPGVNVVTGGAGNDLFVLALTSAGLTPEVRADLGMLKTWMDAQAAAAGSLAALAAQTTGPSLTLNSLGITVSLLETVRVTLDGVERPLDYFQNATPAGAATVSASTLEDTALAGQMAISDADGDALNFATFRNPSHGTLALNAATGEYTYTPAADFAGSDSFTVRAVDPAGASVTQTVMIGVMAVNDAPVTAAAVALDTTEDAEVSGQILAGDVEGDVLAYSLDLGPQNGTVTLDAETGTYTYAPDADYNGADAFTVLVADGKGGVASQTVSLTVTAVNDAPVADAVVSLVTIEDQAVAGQVVATDVDGDTPGFAVGQGPAHGTLTLDAATGAYTYAAEANYAGADQFTVDVTDGNGGVVTQIVSVGVTAVADAPVLGTSNQTISLAGGVMLGSTAAETLIGGAGITHILGGAGNDVIHAGNSDVVTAELGITAALQDLDGSETLSLSITGLPAGASLSAGMLQPDGSWLLGAADLAGLKLTTPTAADFSLSVTATATEADGSTATTSQSLSIAFDRTQAASIVEGGSGSDAVTGSDAGDVIYGGSRPNGGISLPSVPTEADNDVLHGGDGNDTIYGQSGNDQLYGEAGNDWLSGGKGDDVLAGGGGANVIFGNSGDDTVLVEGAGDTVDGGCGFDTLDFSAVSQGLTINVGVHTAIGAGTTEFKGIEKIVGSGFADSYVGSSGGDVFVGGAGDDMIRGLGGADTLTGGSGNDTFVYFKKDAGALDHITDFSVGDRIDLRDFTKSLKFTSINSVMHVSNGGDGATLSVKLGSSFVDVVKLDGVSGLNVNDMLAQGMILT